MLLGLATGKVGDLVFYRDGGEQRTRTRVIPKNPRSPRQMAQRVKLANVVNTFRQLQSVIADSFTGRPSNQSGYNAFAKGAITISPYMSKEAAVRGSVVPSPYLISRGTIDALPYALRETGMRKGLELAVANLVAEGATAGTVSSALLAAYPFLANGDELHFILMGFSSEDLDNGDKVYTPATRFVSMVIDSTSNVSLDLLGFAVEDGFLFLPNAVNYDEFQGAVVVSRVDGSGQLQVSTAQLALSKGAQTAYEESSSEDVRIIAVDSYGVGEQSLLRD